MFFTSVVDGLVNKPDYLFGNSNEPFVINTFTKHLAKKNTTLTFKTIM